MTTARRDGKSVIEEVAAYAAAESFERLPADAVRAARLATSHFGGAGKRRALLDTRDATRLRSPAR